MAPLAALVVRSVARPVEDVTTTTTTAVVEEEVEDTLPATTTVMVETVTTALVIPAMTTVEELPVASTVTPAVRTATEAVAERAVARIGTATVEMIGVLANHSLTVTVTAATPVPPLRMRPLARLRVAGAMEATRTIAADTEDRKNLLRRIGVAQHWEGDENQQRRKFLFHSLRC